MKTVPTRNKPKLVPPYIFLLARLAASAGLSRVTISPSLGLPGHPVGRLQPANADHVASFRCSRFRGSSYARACRRLSLCQSRTVRGHLGERDRVLGPESHGPFGRKVRDLQDAGPRPRGPEPGRKPGANLVDNALVSVSNTGRPVAPAEVDRRSSDSTARGSSTAADMASGWPSS